MVAGTRLSVRLFVYCLYYTEHSLVFMEMCPQLWNVVVGVLELGAVLGYFTNRKQ